jgi:hypothetical protein
VPLTSYSSAENGRTMINSIAISVAIIGGLVTWASLATGAFLIWAAFVACACFFNVGGDAAAFKTTIISNLFGVFVAWLTGLVVAEVSGGPALSALIVAISIVAYILAAHIKLLSAIPAVTYGYACAFAYLTQNANAFTPDVMLSASLGNALVVVPFSMIIGACFAYASALLAAQLNGKFGSQSKSVSSS